MKVLGLAGLKGSGKDTVCEMMIEHLADSGLRGTRVAFADKVKIAAAKALGFDRPDDELFELMNSLKNASSVSVLYDEPGLELSTLHEFTGREYLQNFGHGCREVFGEDFWIEQILPGYLGYEAEQRYLHNTYPETDVLIVTDCRYDNEARRVADLGRVVLVERQGLESDGHASENPVDRAFIYTTIENDRSHIDLFWTVESCLTTIGVFV